MASKQPRETGDVAAGLTRQIKALGRRVAAEDPEQLIYLAELETALAAARAEAIAGLREGGSSDVQIGRVLGISRQAVRQRWPWHFRVDGARRRMR